MTSFPSLEQFLLVKTPVAWLEQARDHMDLLLIDHANCEKKAALSAIHLIHRYVDYPELLVKMSQLAREELLHFEKVLAIMAARNIDYYYLSPSRYAANLNEAVRKPEPARFIDRLIIGAFIEARSCERFHALIPYVDDELAKFYRSLFAAEKRHFTDYLQFAENYSDEPIESRVQFFRESEAQLITGEDDEFRFHSGVPKG